MDALEALKTRRSVRAYQDKPVAREVLTDLVDCAGLAPSAMNQQVWEFIVITEPQTLADLTRIIGHCTWLPSAAAAIAVCGKASDFLLEDASAATQNLLLAACAHGLGSCWIAGEKQAYADAVRQRLGVPEGYRFFALVAVGHAAERPAPEKRSLQSVLHWEKF